MELVKKLYTFLGNTSSVIFTSFNQHKVFIALFAKKMSVCH